MALKEKIETSKIDDIITLDDSEDEDDVIMKPLMVKKNPSNNFEQSKNVVNPNPPRRYSTLEVSDRKNISTSRRKSLHHKRQIEDDISFENVAVAANTQSDTISSTIKNKSVSKETRKSCLDEQVPESIKDNDNLSLMKRVAFLKASVNYTLLQIGVTPYPFNGPVTLSHLINHYFNSKQQIDKISEKSN